MVVTINRRTEHEEEISFSRSTREIEHELKKLSKEQKSTSRLTSPLTKSKNGRDVKQTVDESDHTYSDPYNLFTAPSQTLVDEELIV